MRTCVQEKGITPEELRSYLKLLPVSTKHHKLTLLNAEKKEKLKNKETIAEIFEFIVEECYTSFLNCDIFQSIVKKYNIKEDRKELKYCDHLQAFFENHRIKEFVEVSPQLESKSKSAKLILKFDVVNTCKLAEIVELKKFVAELLEIKPSAFDIIDIKEGCIVVTLLIPTSVADALFTPDTVFTSQQEEDFRAASVLWLECNGHTYHFKARPNQHTGAVKVT